MYFVHRQCQLVEACTNETGSTSVKFCDIDSHNKYAPTKQNQMCDRQSVLEVILRHPDFANEQSDDARVNRPSNDLTLKFTYKRRLLTRYALILDETQDTMVRESWTFLRLAIRNWVVYDLPSNTEVGVILANDSGSSKQFDLSSLDQEKNRNLIASFIPFSPGESQKPACMNCAVRDALAMLEKQSKYYGAAHSVILIISPGMDAKTEYLTLGSMAKQKKIHISTINYPGIIHRKPLDALAKLTRGLSFTLFETKHNSERSCLSTYFHLVNMLRSIMAEYYEGNKFDLPIEIHRKKLFDINDEQSNKRRLITGSFLVDDTMGVPSVFLIYTHSTEYPLINSAILNSPNGIRYFKRSDERLSVKQLSIEAQINETGSWTYTIDRFNGNPQPHYVQVLASVQKDRIPVIKVNAWIQQQHFFDDKIDFQNIHLPITIYVEVKKGDLPVSDALVEVLIRRPDFECDMSTKCEKTLRICDTGGGDPDVTKGDGIYTRYFNPISTGAGIYQLHVRVTDNGNTAYSLPDGFNINFSDLSGTKCCGSFVPYPSKQPLPTFQRIVPTLTVFVSEKEIHNDIIGSEGKMGDVRLESVDTTRIILSWTAPDMGGLNVARYEVRYSYTLQDIVDHFDTSVLWMHDSPLAFSIGDHTEFTMNISADPSLIGKSFFIAVRPYARLANDSKPGPVSNYVHVYVQTPLPVTNLTTTSNVHQPPNNDGVPHKSSNYSIDLKSIVIIIIIAVITVILFCCFASCYYCLYRRRNKCNEKLEMNAASDVGIHSKNIVVGNNFIPPLNNENSIQRISSPSPPKQDDVYQDHPQFDQMAYIVCTQEIPNPHTVGLPLYHTVNDMNKQQPYAMIHDLENHFYDNYKQENHTICQPPDKTSDSISDSNALPRNSKRQILSPYQSWTASQLLLEHERRENSLDDSTTDFIIEQDAQPNADHVLLIQNRNRNEKGIPTVGIVNLTTGVSPTVPSLPCPLNNSVHQKNHTFNSGDSAQLPSSSNYSMFTRNNDLFQSLYKQNTNSTRNNNYSLHGSLCSVHSVNDIKKKKRTITMV